MSHVLEHHGPHPSIGYYLERGNPEYPPVRTERLAPDQVTRCAMWKAARRARHQRELVTLSPAEL